MVPDLFIEFREHFGILFQKLGGTERGDGGFGSTGVNVKDNASAEKKPKLEDGEKVE